MDLNGATDKGVQMSFIQNKQEQTEVLAKQPGMVWVTVSAI